MEIREIALAPLSLGDVTQLVVDSLHAEADCAKLLAQLIHEKTDGNPFFAIQFFRALAEEKLLVFDVATAAWRWDLEQIRIRGFSGNISELVTDKLGRLSDATLQILKQLACLGSKHSNVYDQAVERRVWQIARRVSLGGRASGARFPAQWLLKIRP
jgi:predicted ATPase